MRLLHLDLGPELRGGQRQVLYLDRWLRQAGVMSAIACPAGSPLAAQAAAWGADVVALPGRRPWDPRVFAAVAQAIRRGQSSILHTHDSQAATLGALISLKFPSVGLAHTRRVSYHIRGAVSRWKYLRHHAIGAVSRETAQALMEAGIPAERIRVIHSAIDVSSYQRALPQEAGPLTIGVIGALTQQKGHAVFLKALALLRGMNVPLFRARITGDGPLRSGLESLARELQVNGVVRWDGYMESRAVLPRLQVLAVPSVDGEGSSAVIKEGWASGVPVVASALPSNLELVTPEVNGLAAVVGSDQSLAECLARVLTDASLREQLVANGLESVEGFDVRPMGQAYEEMYRQLTRRGAG